MVFRLMLTLKWFILLALLHCVSCFQYFRWISIARTTNSKLCLKKYVDVCIDVPRELGSSRFLNMSGLPFDLNSRNKLGTHLYVRDCFDPLLNEMHSHLAARDVPHPAIGMVGTAGVGKSSFATYCLMHHLRDPSTFIPHSVKPSKSFYFQTMPSKAAYFEHKKNNCFRVSTVDNLDLRIPLFADLIDLVSPLFSLGPTLIFSSFQPLRYKERLKEGLKLIMPVWNYQEMCAYVDDPLFVQFSSMTPYFASSIKERFKYFGGSIRQCLLSARSPAKCPKDKITKVITREGEQVALQYFRVGYGLTEDDNSDMLVHKTVPYVRQANGTFTYPTAFDPNSLRRQFVSPHVRRMVFRHHAGVLLKSAKYKFWSSVFGGGDARTLFKEVAYHALKTGSVIMKFNATELLPATGCKTAVATVHTVEFPHVDALPRNWNHSDFTDLKANVLYLPVHGTLTADLFSVCDVEEVPTLCLILMTIGAKYTIDLRGVEDIVNAIKRSGLRYQSVKIYFATPRHSKLHTRHNIVDKRGSRINIEDIPLDVRSIIHDQYRIVFNFDEVDSEKYEDAVFVSDKFPRGPHVDFEVSDEDNNEEVAEEDGEDEE